MRRRLGRPSLLGTAARTAVITGTAAATMNAMSGASRREPAPQAAQPAPSPEGSALTDVTLAKLKQLGELHAQGVLNDAEFSQAKAKLLA